MARFWLGHGRVCTILYQAKQEAARSRMPREQTRRHAWIATKNEQAEENPVGKKTSTTRVGKKSFAVGKTTAARTSFGYSAPKKSFGPAPESAKPVKWGSGSRCAPSASR